MCWLLPASVCASVCFPLRLLFVDPALWARLSRVLHSEPTHTHTYPHTHTHIHRQAPLNTHTNRPHSHSHILSLSLPPSLSLALQHPPLVYSKGTFLRRGGRKHARCDIAIGGHFAAAVASGATLPDVAAAGKPVVTAAATACTTSNIPCCSRFAIANAVASANANTDNKIWDATAGFIGKTFLRAKECVLERKGGNACWGRLRAASAWGHTNEHAQTTRQPCVGDCWRGAEGTAWAAHDKRYRTGQEGSTSDERCASCVRVRRLFNKSALTVTNCSRVGVGRSTQDVEARETCANHPERVRNWCTSREHLRGTCCCVLLCSCGSSCCEPHHVTNVALNVTGTNAASSRHERSI